MRSHLQKNLPVMTGNGFAESVGSIHSRSVNQNRVEEHSITFENV